MRNICPIDWIIGPGVMALSVLGLVVLLSGCGTVTDFFKPALNAVSSGVTKTGEAIDLFRDKDCEPAESDKCRWQTEAFSTDG